METPSGLSFRFENRTYDLHRPEGCTVVAIEREGWPGNEFGLWLPEAALSWANWKGKESLQEWSMLSDNEARWEQSEDRADIVTTLVVDQQNDCAWYSHTFRNVSEVPLEKVTAQTCFHLVNAPEFISIRGERIWACLDGKWRTTNTVPRDLSLDPRRVKFMRSGSRAERTIVHVPGFPHSIMAEEASHPLIIAESFDGQKSVGVACRGMSWLFNNNDPILRCIHSEPMPIASIQPGDSACQEGVILFCGGDHEALIDQYSRIVPSGW